jgi:hypothetical protein
MVWQRVKHWYIKAYNTVSSVSSNQISVTTYDSATYQYCSQVNCSFHTLIEDLDVKVKDKGKAIPVTGCGDP